MALAISRRSGDKTQSLSLKQTESSHGVDEDKPLPRANSNVWGPNNMLPLRPGKQAAKERVAWGVLVFVKGGIRRDPVVRTPSTAPPPHTPCPRYACDMRWGKFRKFGLGSEARDNQEHGGGGGDSAGPKDANYPSPPPGASGQQLVAKGAALSSPWAPKVPDTPWAPKPPKGKFVHFAPQHYP